MTAWYVKQSSDSDWYSQQVLSYYDKVICKTVFRFRLVQSTNFIILRQSDMRNSLPIQIGTFNKVYYITTKWYAKQFQFRLVQSTRLSYYLLLFLEGSNQSKDRPNISRLASVLLIKYSVLYYNVYHIKTWCDLTIYKAHMLMLAHDSGICLYMEI